MAKKDKKSFVLYNDYLKHLETLTDNELGSLFRAILYHANGKQTPLINDKLELVFSFIKEQMDRDESKYVSKCQKNAEISRNYWNSVKTNNNQMVSNEIQTLSNEVKRNSNETERNRTISYNDTDNDTDNDNDTDIDIKSIRESIKLMNESNFTIPEVIKDEYV